MRKIVCDFMGMIIIFVTIVKSIVSFDEEDSLANRTSQAPVQKQFRNQNMLYSKPFAQYLPHQQFLLEKYRLKFLRDCVPLKRPPHSLRISSANSIKQEEKVHLFSKLESELLQLAIKNKLNEIRSLNLRAEEVNDTSCLSVADEKSIKAHYNKKIEFYQHQDNTKWSDWPFKSTILAETDKANKRKARKNSDL